MVSAQLGDLILQAPGQEPTKQFAVATAATGKHINFGYQPFSGVAIAGWHSLVIREASQAGGVPHGAGQGIAAIGLVFRQGAHLDD